MDINVDEIIEVGDMIIGYQKAIPFSLLLSDNYQHVATFKPMQTSDGSTYVITYQWSDWQTRTFNENEVALYIGKININNEEQATDIFAEVYNGLKKAYINNPHQNYDLAELVNSVIDKSSKKYKK